MQNFPEGTARGRADRTAELVRAYNSQRLSAGEENAVLIAGRVFVTIRIGANNGGASSTPPSRRTEGKKPVRRIHLCCSSGPGQQHELSNG